MKAKQKSRKAPPKAMKPAKKRPAPRKPVKAPPQPQALISVYFKDGVVGLGFDLIDLGYRIISTGGTAKALRENGVRCTDVSKVTGFPEMLEGRLKTIHPVIAGGILAMNKALHSAQLKRHGIDRIKVVAVNLYPFSQTVASGASHAEIIEKIDIGGVLLLRAAAKNADEGVVVLCDPADYQPVLKVLREQGEVPLEMRQKLAEKVFEVTAVYDAAICQYLAAQFGELLLPLLLKNGKPTRYGSNPHQQGWIYDIANEPENPLSLGKFRQINGKAMSLNNWHDLFAAKRVLCQIYAAIEKTTGQKPDVAVGVKHTNPCGAAFSLTQGILAVIRKMLDGDRLAIFGGIVVMTAVIDKAIAELLLDTARQDPACEGKDRFLEVIAAPGFTEEALELLGKKANLRLLVNEALAAPVIAASLNMLKLEDKMLVEESNSAVVTPDTWEQVVGDKLSQAQELTLVLAEAVCQCSKSNTITLARYDDNVYWLKGNGTGQMSRVHCAELAVKYAGDDALGSAAASDALFPKIDGPQTLIDAGITACISVKGSIKDAEVIEVFKNAGVALVLHDKRGFVHFP